MLMLRMDVVNSKYKSQTRRDRGSYKGKNIFCENAISIYLFLMWYVKISIKTLMET